ncbi:MAG: ATP-binding protein [Planctomycetaceae bacterium]|jgi:hypothetical protein|nr:ATP-binding protein [Planctomycetaceae bacterium]
MSLNLLTGIQSEPFRLLVHGTEGIGKSTFAACAPEPVFVQTEDGLGQIDVPKFPLAENYDTVVKNLSDLVTEKHDFETAVIDSVDWLEKLAVIKVLEMYKGKASIADIDYGKGYAMLIPLFEKVLNLCNELRRKRRMNIIMIAHTKMEKVEDPSGSSYDQYAPRLDKRINGMIKEWADVIAFATHAIRKEEIKEGFDKRTVAKTIKQDGNTRIIFLESTPAIVAKSRYPLPESMPLDGEQFFGTLWSTIYPPETKTSTKKGK